MEFRTVRSAACLAVLAGTSFAQGTLFPVTHSYPAVDAPYGSALADLNADGNLDCLVANYYTDKVTVLIGTGTGSFNTQPPLAVGGEPRGLVVADLNGDTKPDLVTVNSTSNSVSVLLGDGTGSFGAPTLFPTSPGAFPTCIDAGDLNHDGKLDIVTGDQATNSLSVLLGNGTGGLGAPSSQFTGFSAERIELADMNVDGDLDCVCLAYLDDAVAVNLGDGNGNLIAGVHKFTASPKGLAVGDVNEDGVPDVVVASSQADVLYVFRGNGAGGLIAPQVHYLPYGNHYTTSVMLIDASGDGRLDLIACGASNPLMTVLIGVGGGDFDHAHAAGIAESAYDAVAGDLNGDGFADVVTSNLTVDSIRVHISAGVGSWERYCTPKTNSLGCVPKIEAVGTPSVSNPRPFRVYVYDVLDSKPGLFLYTVGGTQASIPFQGGTLCVGPTAIRRTPAMNSGTNPKVPSPNCEGVYTLDFNAFAQGLAGGNPAPGLLVLGNTYQLQAWSRDPGFAAPNNSGLSPALDVTPWQ